MSSEYDDADLFHFIMRLPENVSTKLQNDIDASVPLENKFYVQLHPNKRQAEVVYEDELLHGRLMDLPCVVEMLKSLDMKTFYKAGDVGQIMLCSETKSVLPESKFPVHALNRENLDKQHQMPHGLTAPLKNVRKKRFRKTLKKKTMDWLEVEREVKKLIRDDLLAGRVEWQLLYTDDEVSRAMQGLDTMLQAPAGSEGTVAVAAGTASAGSASGANLPRMSSQDKLNELFGDLTDSEEDDDEDDEDTVVTGDGARP